jgi:hypothetical protein
MIYFVRTFSLLMLCSICFVTGMQCTDPSVAKAQRVLRKNQEIEIDARIDSDFRRVCDDAGRELVRSADAYRCVSVEKP